MAEETCGVDAEAPQRPRRMPCRPPRRSAGPDSSRSSGPRPAALSARDGGREAAPSAAARTGCARRPVARERDPGARGRAARRPARAVSERWASACIHAYIGASTAS